MGRFLALAAAGLAALALALFGWSWLTRNPADLSLRALGETAGEAYVYGYPLVLTDATRRALMARDPEPALNRLRHRRTLPTAADRSVVRPNLDTLYSIAWLDLSEGPVVLRTPDFGARAWLFQVLDAWTDVAGAPGSRTLGGAPRRVLIAGPGWDGPRLDGMELIRVSTPHAWIIARIAVAPGEALEPIHALQDAASLSGARAVAPISAPDAAPPDLVATLTPDAFFERLAALMTVNPPRAVDAPMVARLAALGVDEAGDYSADGFGPLARRAKARGVELARERLAAATERRPYGLNYWRTVRTGLGDYGDDYALRAAVALIGFGANRPEDAIYPNTDRDGAGRPLDGAHVYRLRFPAGGLPPVDAFWSLTLYDANGYLVGHPAGRHAINGQDPLNFDEDGGLTLHISARRPDGIAPSNWLPTPDAGPFALTARLYAPRPDALSGAWDMPAIERVED